MNKFLASAGLAACIAMGVTAAEARSPFGPGSALYQLFALADTNNDGVVEDAEIDALRAERFDRIDTDGDGILSDAEIRAVQEAAAEALRDMIVLIPVVGPEFFMNILGGTQNADLDGDGEISRDEFVAARGRLFDRVDADNDGNLTEEEVREAREEMAERRGHGVRGGWRN